MKLLYSSVILLITLVVAVQNLRLPKGSNPLRPSSTYCSSECEIKYFPKLRFQSRMWADIFLPLPTFENDWNTTCSRTTEFLACSVSATVGCRMGSPPMMRLAQVRDAYGYLCLEGAQKFLNAMPCLCKYYKQEDTEKCVKQRKNKTPRGPDGDLCIELENAHNCAKENAMKTCGKDASDFMSIYVEKTHKEIKRFVNCDKFKN